MNNRLSTLIAEQVEEMIPDWSGLTEVEKRIVESTIEKYVNDRADNPVLRDAMGELVFMTGLAKLSVRKAVSALQMYWAKSDGGLK